MATVNNSFLSRMSRIAKAEGARGIAGRIRNKAKQLINFQYAYILKDPLIPVVPVPAPKVDVQVVQVTAEDAQAVEDLSLLVEQEYAVPSAKQGILERLGQGELCYISQVDEKVVGHLWVRVSGLAASDFEGLKFYLAPDEVYYHDVYVAPEQRGKNITPTMKLLSGRDIADRMGKKQALAVVFSTNHASLRAFRKFGAQRTGVIGYLKLFGAKFPFLFRHRLGPL